MAVFSSGAAGGRIRSGEHADPDTVESRGPHGVQQPHDLTVRTLSSASIMTCPSG